MLKCKSNRNLIISELSKGRILQMACSIIFQPLSEFSGSINKVPFSKNCMAEPKGDLLQQSNPTCRVDTYAGGLLCCHHQNVLLDKDQEQPSQVMTYHLKFR